MVERKKSTNDRYHAVVTCWWIGYLVVLCTSSVQSFARMSTFYNKKQNNVFSARNSNVWYTNSKKQSTFTAHALSPLKESSSSNSINKTISLLSDDTTIVDTTGSLSSTTNANTVTSVFTPGIKLRRLKDTMWIRETLEDLTAAEFALSVESTTDTNDEFPKKSKRLKKRAVDYEKLVSQLDQRISNLGCDLDGGTVNDLRPSESGMGTLTYTEKQRVMLLERLVHTRMSLLHVIRSTDEEMKLIADKLENDAPFKFELPELPQIGIPKETTDEFVSSTSTYNNNTVVSPKLYVRDDGTVDWDGALQDQAALRKFGTAVWARINGRESESIEMSSDDNNNNDTTTNQHQPATGTNKVTAKIEETIEIIESRQKLDELSATLRELERRNVQLLNSALVEGQAVANVRLASLEPSLRNEIRQSAYDVKIMKEKVSYQTLIYELERIYTYLKGDIGNPAMQGYIPLQDRLNVAEFGLLESQIDSLRNQIEANEIVDEDLLTVVYDQLTDFKRRLGIDYFVTGLTFDQETIKRFVRDLLQQTKTGLTFYVKGVRLLWNDIVFCLRLINRAAQGYTLKPREVRTLRRTFKDFLTFIPFVIILLIPLSPIGHVLVFGAIQRFFPDFFPSCFTEQRQNLLQLYENAEYSEFTINETLNQKLSRIAEAFLFFVASSFKKLFFNLQKSIMSNKTDTPVSKDDSTPNPDSKR